MRLLFALLLATTTAQAETLVAAQTIRAKAVLDASDLTLIAKTVPGALSDPNMAVGKEARVTLYAGRPIRPSDIGAPAIVERNQIVPLIYESAIVRITTEARAMARAGIGDRVRAMNLSSRTSVTGTVAADGSIIVSKGHP